MSLYNMLFGKNPLSALVLEALGTTEDGVPRFRDAYFDAENDRLVIHTRTGGGNREYYGCEESCRDHYPEYFEGDEPPSGPWNSDLRKLPGFIYDEDDDFDETYADWYYNIPEAFRPIFDELKALGAGADATPADRWQNVLAALAANRSTPEGERALLVGRRIVSQIADALANKKDPSQ